MRRAAQIAPARRLGIALGLVGVLLAACTRATPIPAGGQQVHIVVSDSGVHLVPSTVRAGEVYLVLDAPPDGSVSFVAQMRSTTATPGPLTDEDLDRLARGDTEFTSTTGLDAGGCDPGQNARDRGQMGPCGNVMKVVVAEGKYAIVAGSPDEDPPASMAVLQVAP